jgi:hypothetical protein
VKAEAAYVKEKIANLNAEAAYMKEQAAKQNAEAAPLGGNGAEFLSPARRFEN